MLTLATLLSAWQRSRAWILYLALAFLSLYPLSRDMWDAVPYVGDGLESVYIVGWNAEQAVRDPLHLFDANVLYPHPHALAFTDHRLLPSLLVAPIIWFTGNPILATNVALFLACLLAAGALRLLAKDLGACEAAAWAAGALYAFHTYQMHEIARLNIVWHGFLPLIIRELILYLREGRSVRAWRLALWVWLQGLSANYHLLYAFLLITLILIGYGVLRPKALIARMPRLVVPTLTAALLFLPIAWPYIQLARAYGHARGLPASMGLEHYLSTLPTNWIWGAIGADVHAQQRGPHFVGFLALALALAALGAWLLRRGGDAESSLLPVRVWVPSAALLALIFIALSLGRNIVWFGHALAPGPYRLLHSYVPGFQLVRIPERLGLIAMLFIALLAARALSLLAQTRARRLVWLLALAVPLEHLSPREEVARMAVGAKVAPVYRFLAADKGRAVAEVPIRGEGLVRQETIEMYHALTHRRPIIHGYTAYPPQLTRLLRRLAAQFPAEVCLQAFERIGVDTVVVHRNRQAGGDILQRIGSGHEARFRRLLSVSGQDLFQQLPAAVAAGRVRSIARFADGDEVYRLQPTPPQPGAPFPPGRRLRSATWRYKAQSGRGDVTALADADLATSWEDVFALTGQEFVEVIFERPYVITGVVLPMNWNTILPTRFVIDGLQGDGAWRPLARFGEAQALQLLDALRANPRQASLGFDVGGQTVSGVRMRVEEGGTSFEGWSMPEFEIWVP